MLRKIFLSSILMTIFFFSQCFAAQDYPICNKDQNDFIKNFNAAASNLGFILGTPELLTTENNPYDEHIYSVDPVPDTFNAGAFILTSKDNFLNRILLGSDNEEIVKKMFKPALLAVGLAENEITAEPVFDKTKTVNSFWCAATKRYINVETASVENNPGSYYILILASSEKSVN